jgi:hypothetical protein
VADLSQQGVELASTRDGLRDEAALLRNELLLPAADSPDSPGSDPADGAESADDGKSADDGEAADDVEYSSEGMCRPPEVGGSFQRDSMVSI